MSVFVDLSSDFGKTASILSDLGSAGIQVRPYPRYKIENEEPSLMAVIIGLKPANICGLDRGCTLDRGMKLGYAKLADIMGFVIIEGIESDMKKEALTLIREKLDSHGFFLVPLDKTNFAVNLIKEIIRNLGALYNEEIKGTNLDTRIEIRKKVHKVVQSEWDKKFMGSQNSANAKRNV
jgi:hypothetical protein